MARRGRFRGLAPSWLARALIALAPGTALADVVEPPPRLCPPGKTGVTSHGGSKCVANAPDCPPGWVGNLGGTCSIRPCGEGVACADGSICVEEAVCLEPFLDEFYDYRLDRDELEAGQAEPPPPGERYLLAAPPPERRRRPSPVYRYRAMNLCAPSVACGAPRTCQREKICVPKGKRASAYAGTNVEPPTISRKTQTPLTVSEVQPDRSTAVAKAVGPHACGGCASPRAPSAGAWAAVAMAAAVAAMRRHSRARGAP